MSKLKEKTKWLAFFLSNKKGNKELRGENS